MFIKDFSFFLTVIVPESCRFLVLILMSFILFKKCNLMLRKKGLYSIYLLYCLDHWVGSTFSCVYFYILPPSDLFLCDDVLVNFYSLTLVNSMPLNWNYLNLICTLVALLLTLVLQSGTVFCYSSVEFYVL